MRVFPIACIIACLRACLPVCLPARVYARSRASLLARADLPANAGTALDAGVEVRDSELLAELLMQSVNPFPC